MRMHYERVISAVQQIGPDVRSRLQAGAPNECGTIRRRDANLKTEVIVENNEMTADEVSTQPPVKPGDDGTADCWQMRSNAERDGLKVERDELKELSAPASGGIR